MRPKACYCREFKFENCPAVLCECTLYILTYKLHFYFSGKSQMKDDLQSANNVKSIYGLYFKWGVWEILTLFCGIVSAR